MDLKEKLVVSGEVPIVCFTYEELVDETSDLTAKIAEAYGPEGYGICIVKNIPNYPQLRAELLPLASKLGQLPKEKLATLEFPQHFYAVGWSHGKEKFLGQRDFSKGSFYGNPQYDNIYPEGVEPPKEGDACAPNVWPKEDIPELEHAFKKLGCFVVDVGLLLTKHIDKYLAKKLPTYEQGKMTRIVRDSKCCKARLLHYFPSTDTKDAESDWCGWHNDHGSLTGLTGAMYFDKDNKEVDWIDPESGLFVQNRASDIKKGAIPKDCLAFQIGETAQVHSGGLLQATPHTVLRGQKLTGTGICRNTFAVFMQPDRDELMTAPEGITREQVYVKETFRVPKLQYRWDEKQTFDEFSIKTIEAYSKGSQDV